MYVLVDDISKCTWILFLEHKDELFHILISFVKIWKENDSSIVHVRSDISGEFVNHSFLTYCEKYGIKHEFSCISTPQQKGMLKEKNKTLQEMAWQWLMNILFHNICG